MWQFIYKDSHKHTFMHIHAFTHARESVWVALVEVPQLPRPPRWGEEVRNITHHL